ncbi:MAG TPA: phage portal protein, partial [Rubrivivax sp.]|nr:phage portal protein [Rubrivivax sp.]
MLDRAIAYLSPRLAAQRAHQRARLGLADAGAMALGVDGTGGGHLPVRRNWAPMPRDANADTLRALPTQRGQSRELARTHPIAVGAMGTLLDRVVGTGLALVAQPAARVLGWGDERAMQWRATVQGEFSLWADSAECDIALAGTFCDLQRMVLSAARESGDCFTVLPESA